ncbi:hypothetical protein [Nocardia brasiliensis]|uniref:hypothetical protein n=1 Tax=Nocardia brasiliensis TaxID=37326 RepID=UPI00245627AF|nr:hypothetical protein [Nocardia brasiliensis]
MTEDWGVMGFYFGSRVFNPPFDRRVVGQSYLRRAGAAVRRRLLAIRNLTSGRVTRPSPVLYAEFGTAAAVSPSEEVPGTSNDDLDQRLGEYISALQLAEGVEALKANGAAALTDDEDGAR